MKKNILIATILSAQLFATDYTTFTDDDLFNSRGTIVSDDRDAFRSEVQSRMQTLSPEERSLYQGSGSGTKTQQKLRDGSGGGNMYKGSRGGGGGGRR